MSRRVAGRSKTSPRKGKLFGRQKVRLGWRKRRIRDLKFLLKAQATGVAVDQALKEAGE